MSELGARASGQGRIFQTSGDQYIQEHHHHYDAGATPLFGPEPPARHAGPLAPDSVRVPLVGRPPGILRNREELRDALSTALAGPGGDAHVVHGMGGCGKTALAHWLFTEAVRAHGRVGFWVNASERMSLRAGMLAVAGDRGAAAGELAAAAAGQRAAADLVWHYLDHSAAPWLLVLDNADDPTVLEDGAWLRTSPRGTVLVTTRHATSPLWRGPGVTRHGLGLLPLDDAAQVLCDLAPDAGDLESARKVAERLGRLPLALTLAGSHLAHQLLESWSMDEYDRKLDEESTSIVDGGARGYGSGQSRQLVGRTWQLSLDALTEQGLPEATTLLRLLSFLAPDPVPLSVLAQLARGQVGVDGLVPPLSAGQLEPALRGLLDHSLAELVEVDGVRCVHAHGVLLDSVAAGVPESGRPDLAEVAAAMLEAALPQPPVRRGNLTLLVPHAMALLTAAPDERTAVLAVRVVRAVHESGDIPAALALASDVVDVAGEALGVVHPVTLDAQDARAKALMWAGRWAESEALFRTVIAHRERVLGPDHLDTLRSCRNIRQPLGVLGRPEDAERFARRAIEGQRRLLGENSLETLDTWKSLLALLAVTGRERELETEASRLLGVCERELPADHPTTVAVRHEYGESLRALGRFEQAEPLARGVLADLVRLHGADHPQAIAALCLTARVAHGLGRTDAVAALEEVIERRERALGPEHPLVASNRAWLTEWQAEGRP
ncbi:tetratricopeptide repeat protein [Streptomyces sp. NPDC057623]|uniref:tetratricopeptide repeat protein n=1 Tax=Streptomyces sp. NPDC057623 TaxID=3346187 RepID=UPI00368EA5CB